MSAIGRAILAAVLIGCAPASSGTTPAPSRARYDHSADRVIVPQMTHPTGIAVTQRHAFVTSEFGIATFDRLLDSWLPPTSEPEEGPARRIRGVAAHPLAAGAWIIEDGSVVHFEPTLGWSMRTVIPGAIESVMFDRRDAQAGIFLRTRGGWMRVSPSGVAMPLGGGELPPPEARIAPPSLEELMQERPALRGYARLLTRDASMRSWPPIVGAAAPEGGDVWLGTLGYGVFRVDPEFMRSVHEPYGLVTPGAGALALATDGVWVAGTNDASMRRTVGGLTFASNDLRDWEWWSPDAGGAMRDASDLVVRGRRAWIATRSGIVRVDLDGSGAAQSLGAPHGLPDDDVRALAARFEGVWVGTARGLTFVPEAWEDPMPAASPRIDGTTLFRRAAVLALAVVGDTLWVGTDEGVFLSDARPGQPAREVPAGTDARLRRRVLALAHHDSVVAVATTEEILLVHARSGAMLPAPAAATVRATGTPETVRLDANTLWIGGPRGVMVIDRATGASRMLAVPRELPGAVRDVALSELFAWIATTDGLVRLRRLPDGSIR